MVAEKPLTTACLRAVRVGQQVVAGVDGLVGQRGDDVAVAVLVVLVVGATRAEVDRDGVGQLALEAHHKSALLEVV